MTDHKFEPFDRVLTRDAEDQEWKADLFSHMEGFLFACVGYDRQICIPYTPETAHLLGTTDPYEPPKPPVEYEWGQKVEVLWNGRWKNGIFVEYDERTPRPMTVLIFGHGDTDCVKSDEIRHLPDSAAHLDAKP